MIRRTFLKFAAVCVIAPALRWLPETRVMESEYDQIVRIITDEMKVQNWPPPDCNPHFKGIPVNFVPRLGGFL